jgi:hypothetical protein
MARFRIETGVDPVTGKIFAEVYYPGDAAQPLSRTKPIYDSQEQAEEHVMNLLSKTFDQPVRRA